MEVFSTSTISTIDLVNFSQNIAQLNLGYLGISVAILGVLGSVFIYFNIKPLKDALDKQEGTISDLRKEADDLLNQSSTQTQSTLENFKKDQFSSLSQIINQERENINLEIINKIQAVESVIVEKIDSISSERDSKLKEILLSEMANKILSLEKSLTAVIEEHKKTNDKKFELFANKTKNELQELTADVLELKAYKYDMEGKMGGIIYTITALEKCLRDTPYLLKFKLDNLKEKIGKYTLSPELFIQLQTILKKVEEVNNNEHRTVIQEIKNLITVESRPEV